MVSPKDDELRKLTDQFVLVRLIQMGGVDLNVFQFDPHVSWALFFMNSDKTIYGRYGRAHPASKRDRKDSNPNPSVDGLKAALSKALEIHAGYAGDPDAWTPRLAGKTGPPPHWRFPEKTPSAKKYKRLKRIDAGEAGCVHCHEVHRTALDSHFMVKKPLPESMLYLYPRPAVLGLTMHNDRRARVRTVAVDSPAADAGLKPGDDIVSLGGQPLCSIADLQWVLHTYADEGGALPAVVQRAGKELTVSIALEAGWRRAEDFAWRYRTFGYAMWLWTGVTLADAPDGIRVAARSPWWFKKQNTDGRRTLEVGDVIVEVDSRSDFDRSGLMAYLIRDKKLGATIKMTIVRRGEHRDVAFKMPKKRPEVMGH